MVMYVPQPSPPWKKWRQPFKPDMQIYQLIYWHIEEWDPILRMWSHVVPSMNKDDELVFDHYVKLKRENPEKKYRVVKWGTTGAALG